MSVAETGKASWLQSPITCEVNSSAFLPEKSPLRRHPRPPTNQCDRVHAPHPARRCDACLGLAIGFEILFGEYYDRLLERGRLLRDPVLPED